MPAKNAADELSGFALTGGWTVGEKLRRGALDTGGYFSVSYVVWDKHGRQAFLKALDLSRVFGAPDPARLMQDLTTAFNFERDLLDHCGRKRMRHVVRAVADGQVEVPECAPLSVVNYLIFEHADGGDVRAYLRAADAFDAAFVMRTLHNVSAGLQQLHSDGIAHQDLKPSNVLVFPDSNVRKIADLGRASVQGVAGPHDGFRVAGDQGYSPPELLYGEVDAQWGARRVACDLYHLGSLLCFFFLDLGTTPLLLHELEPTHHPTNWGGSYREVLPYVESAFSRVAAQTLAASPRRAAPRPVEGVY